MRSVLFDQQPKHNGPDPLTVAIYSVIPGVGQLYNGKTKKGILFLVATFISLLILYASLNPSTTLDFAFILFFFVKIIFFWIKFDLEPSPAAESLMEKIKFGGSFSTSVIIIVILFILYSMYDAYSDADGKYRDERENAIIAGSTMFRFSESTTSSYIIHILIFSTLFLMSLYLVMPRKDIEQVTEIEFIMPQVESKQPPPPETKRRSTVQSVDQGKHDPKKEITIPQKAQPRTAPPQPKQQEQQVQMMQPPKPQQPKPVQPAPQPKSFEPPKPKLPVPKAEPKAIDRAGLLPSQPKPAPINPSTSDTNTSDAPKPVAPAPESNPGSAANGAVSAMFAVAPRIPGLGTRGGIGLQGNPPPNSNPNGPSSIAAKKDLDFGPYMEELQRRIKRSWKPPRGNESKRVIVTFRVNSSGELSDLSIKKSSNFQPSDDAALLAVRTAAPFARLPEGAPPVVDIEFTFDYNVFGGGR